MLCKISQIEVHFESNYTCNNSINLKNFTNRYEKKGKANNNYNFATSNSLLTAATTTTSPSY